jgi:dipeptidyl aminopeptidase/acylaminoacyl peptidase
MKVSALALACALAVSGGSAMAQTGETVTLSPVEMTGTRPVAPTIAELAAFPLMSNFVVSPDGRHMAALEGRGEDRTILVWDTSDLSRAPARLTSNQMKIRAVSFVKNDVLGVSLWQPYSYNFGGGVTETFLSKFMLTDLQGRNWRDPMSVVRTRSEGEAEQARLSSPSVVDDLPNDPDNILLAVGAEIYRLNVHTDRSERIQRSGERTLGYETDLQGNLRVRVVVDRDDQGLYTATEFRRPDGGWDEHIRSYIKDREVFSIAAFSADPNIAYVISNRNRDKAAIFEYNVATRQIGELMFEHPLFEATGVNVERVAGPNFGEIISFSYGGPRSSSYPILPEYAALRTGVEQALGVEETPVRITDPATGNSRNIRYANDRYIRIDSMSDDMNTAVVWAGGVNDPGQYYLLKNGRDLTPLAEPYPNIDPASLGSTSLVYYKARDGLDIPAFLSKPSEALFGAGPYPTVIMPHGGPWSRDELTWDGSMWRQLLTSRGYAVLQPQYRGSDGWGRRLWVAGDNEWGQKMQDDLDDGVSWLVSEGVAQEGHVAMYGFSYGGYAAMAAAVRPNGLYKCAIAGAGVSDLTRIRSSLFQNPYTREAQRDTVSGLSPVNSASSISIPIMVFHGVRDTTVELEQSDAFVRNARASGQDVQYHVLQDYAHGPAWTRAIASEQLSLIDDYLRTGCGGSGL